MDEKSSQSCDSITLEDCDAISKHALGVYSKTSSDASSKLAVDVITKDDCANSKHATDDSGKLVSGVSIKEGDSRIKGHDVTSKEDCDASRCSKPVADVSVKEVTCRIKDDQVTSKEERDASACGEQVMSTSGNLWQSSDDQKLPDSVLIEHVGRPVFYDDRRWAVEEACKRASDDQLLVLYDHCTGEQLDIVVTEAVTRKSWDIVTQLLRKHRHRPKTANTARWIVEEACKHADDDNFSEIVRSGYTDRIVINEAIRRRLWRIVADQLVMTTIVYHPLYRGRFNEIKAVSETARWAVEEACKYADDEGFSCVVAARHGDNSDQLETVMTEAVRRRSWKTVNKLLTSKHITSICNVHRWAVEEASGYADDDQLSKTVFYCFDDQLEHLLTNAVRRCVWKTVSVLLRQIQARNINDFSETRNWAVAEACKTADDEHLSDIVIYCKDEYLEKYTKETVARGVWKTVDVLLKQLRDRNISNTSELQRWTVEKACNYADDDRMADIVIHCLDDQLEPLLTVAVRRGLWNTLLKLLRRIKCRNASNTAYETQRWAVEEACKVADDDHCSGIVIYCMNDQIEILLTEAVRRGLWKTVSKLLKPSKADYVRGISDTRRWAVDEACKRTDDHLLSNIVKNCEDDQVDAVLTTVVSRGFWRSVAALLRRITDKSSKLYRWAVEEAYKRADDFVLSCIATDCEHEQTDDVLTTLVQRGMWESVLELLGQPARINNTTFTRAVEEASESADGRQLQDLLGVIHPRYVATIAKGLLRRSMTAFASNGLDLQFQKLELEERLSLWATIFVSSLSTGFQVVSTLTEQNLQDNLDLVMAVNDMTTESVVTALVSKSEHDNEISKAVADKESRLWSRLRSVFKNKPEQIDGDVCVHFLKWCSQRRGNTAGLLQKSLPLLTWQTLNPALQSLARKSMWEETRRWYLRFLVEEKLWDMMKELADHSLYDDQRGWALGQALEEKQWDVVVVLADHGLTDDQMRRVYRQVAKHANWDTVSQLFDRGVCMREVCEELTAANPSRERPPTRERIERYRHMGEDVTKLEEEYRERCEHVAKIEREYRNRCAELTQRETLLSCEGTPIERLLLKRKWYAALSKLRQNLTDEHFELTFQSAVQNKAWNVVMQLVRQGMNVDKRNSLFPMAIQQQQWGLGRALLERGVSVELSRAALPELIEADQWILVARVMELSLDDTERRRAMQVALDKKEGSVVAHGMSVLEGRLSVEERKALFKHALSHGMWQAVKRLVEEKDSTGIAQRDEALVAAVEHNQWDIVDHCQRHGGDINKRNKWGSTLLHTHAVRSTRGREEGLLHHGADPNLPNSEGDSFYHLTLNSVRRDPFYTPVWQTIKLATEFHGNLNQRDPDGHSALYKLIRLAFGFQRQPARIIDCATLWGSDVGERVDYKGQTALHVVCQAGLWQSIRYIVARGGDPLAVTNDGKTAITAALEYKRKLPAKSKSQGGWEEACEKREAEVRDCRQKLVAECIKLGISTHQPRATDSADSVSRSPVLISIEKKDIVVLHMLYESGACSHRELQKVLDHTFSSDAYQKSEYRNCITYLDQIASTPRRLVSMCRLVISHHLGVHWIRKKRNVPKPRPDMYRIPNTTGVRCNRQTRAEHLPLPRPMRNYVLFSDLVDPDYGKDLRDNEDGVRMKDSKGHGL